MADISPERVLYARIFLGQFYQFKQLERVNTNEVGWLMLKVSCTRVEAEQLLQAVEQDPGKRELDERRQFRPPDVLLLASDRKEEEQK